MDYLQQLENIKNQMENKNNSLNIKKLKKELDYSSNSKSKIYITPNNIELEKLRNGLILAEVKNNINKTPYNSSELKAIKNDFYEIQDATAYNGRYFIKDNLIWIHNIEALKKRLGIFDENTLKLLKYDIDTYYKLN